MKIRELIKQILQKMETDFNQLNNLQQQDQQTSIEQSNVLTELKFLSELYANDEAEFNLTNPFYPENINFGLRWTAALQRLTGNKYLEHLQSMGRTLILSAQELAEEEADDIQLQLIKSNLSALYLKKKEILLSIPEESARMETLFQSDIREEEAAIYLDCFTDPNHRNIIMDMFPSLKSRFVDNDNNVQNTHFKTLDEIACHLMDMPEEKEKLAFVRYFPGDWKSMIQSSEALDCLLACFENTTDPFFTTLKFNLSHLKATPSQIGLNKMDLSVQSQEAEVYVSPRQTKSG